MITQPDITACVLGVKWTQWTGISVTHFAMILGWTIAVYIYILGAGLLSVA